MPHRKTPVAAREVNLNYGRLMNMVRYGLIPAPQRDSSGDYLWSDADLARVRDVLARRAARKKAVPANA